MQLVRGQIIGLTRRPARRECLSIWWYHKALMTLRKVAFNVTFLVRSYQACGLPAG
jgi:hypothetical protein